MTIFCPSAFSSSAAVTRVTWSVEPPAAHGTMMVIGFVGFHCAAAPNDTAASTAAAATRAKRLVAMRARSIIVALLLEVDFGAGGSFNRFVKRLQRGAPLDYTSLVPRRLADEHRPAHPHHRRRLVPGPRLARRPAVRAGAPRRHTRRHRDPGGGRD